MAALCSQTAESTADPLCLRICLFVERDVATTFVYADAGS